MGTETETRREARALLQNTTLYREFQAEKDEILKHKWIESEKVGHDIGFEKALVDWITAHPEAQTQPAGAVLHKALAERFPCKGKK